MIVFYLTEKIAEEVPGLRKKLSSCLTEEKPYGMVHALMPFSLPFLFTVLVICCITKEVMIIMHRNIVIFDAIRSILEKSRC